MSVLKHRRALFLLLIIFSLIFSAFSAYAQTYIAGVHYTLLQEDAETHALESRDGKPAVTEIFWYGCPRCYAFDPLLEAWVEQKGDDITFSRVPAIWNTMTKQHARVFYAEQSLGVLEQLHRAVFDSIHQQREYLTEEEAVAALFARHDVARDKFAAAFNSFTMDSTLRKTESMIKSLEVPSVPVMVVNGRYMVHIDDAVPTHEAMLDVVEFLLDK